MGRCHEPCYGRGRGTTLRAFDSTKCRWDSAVPATVNDSNPWCTIAAQDWLCRRMFERVALG